MPSLPTNLATIARQWLRLASIGLALLLSHRPLHAQATLDTAGPLLSFSKRLEIAWSAKDTWLFSRIASIAVDKRGQIFVLDDIECNIQVFDSKGTRIRSLGRKGAGPGEMNRPTMLQILGDTVYVHDRGNARFVSFSAATGKVMLNRRGTPGERPFGLSPRGTYRELFAAQAVATNASKIASTIIHTAIATNRSDTLAKPTSVYSDLSYSMFRNVLPSVLAPAKGAVVHTAQPFDDQMLLKATPAGDYIVLAERVAGMDGSRSSRRQPSALRIRRISPNGTALAEFTFNIVARPVSSSDITKVIDSLSNL
ncbi:MAG: 6-bladed beta-propeller, partial [Gemmatimonadaceae bacterium]